MVARAHHAPEVIRRAIAAYDRTKSWDKAARAVSRPGKPVSPRAVKHWIQAHRRGENGPAQKLTRKQMLAELAGLLEEHGLDLPKDRYERLTGHGGAFRNSFDNWTEFRTAALRLVPTDRKISPVRVFDLLKNKPLTLDQAAEQLVVTRAAAQRGIEQARANGYNIHLRGEHYHVENIPGPRQHDPKINVFTSDDRGVLRYGIVSDNHIGSKYARLDVLNDLYDFFQREGITRVYNCGNWIDGEARFNKHDLEPWAHGQDNQLRGFVEHYPRRKGINTYYVAGDDHEGWYDGVDIGLRAMQTARDAGRDDLHYMGYMEAFVRMRDKKSGNGSVAAFVHPGGGSAYAISYSPQKIVESYQGGEKPAVVHLGHYHKMDVFNYRNVWIIQTGCTQDQTPFMRKKRIEAHVGGVLAELRLDSRGAITDCITWQKRYFDRGYYNFQFDRAGPLKRTEVPA